MGRFAAHFRYLVKIRNLANLPYTNLIWSKSENRIRCQRKVNLNWQTSYLQMTRRNDPSIWSKSKLTRLPNHLIQWPEDYEKKSKYKPSTRLFLKKSSKYLERMVGASSLTIFKPRLDWYQPAGPGIAAILSYLQQALLTSWSCGLELSHMDEQSSLSWHTDHEFESASNRHKVDGLSLAICNSRGGLHPGCGPLMARYGS